MITSPISIEPHKNIMCSSTPRGTLDYLYLFLFSMQKLDFFTQLSLDSIWKQQVQECIRNSYIHDPSIKILDHWTLVTLDHIWKQQVQECIHNSKLDNDWDIVEHTPFTEPFWGIIVNK